MTKKEYLDQLSVKPVNSGMVDRIQEIYETELPDIVKKIISDSSKAIFFDDEGRMLSIEEIADAKQDLHVDFKDKGMIPLADCGENDFIVYHFQDDFWSKFNIIDETVFKKKDRLEELLK